jgi:hypothetical protein
MTLTIRPPLKCLRFLLRFATDALMDNPSSHVADYKQQDSRRGPDRDGKPLN